MMQTTVGALLSNAAKRFGEKTAIVYEDQKWSFRELDNSSTKLAAGLRACGIKAGDVVTLYSPNCPEWVVSYYAVLKLGAIVNPLNLMLTPEEAAYAMNDCQASAVLGSAEKIAGLLNLPGTHPFRVAVAYGGDAPLGSRHYSELLTSDATYAQVDALSDDASLICTIGYTSGTTGHPKGAVLTHRNILMNVAMTATMHLRTCADTVVSALPCSHVYGNVVMNAAIGYGMTFVLHRSFDVERVLQSIEIHAATIFEGVPTMYMYMLSSPLLKQYDLSSLTRCTVGGQTMPVQRMEEVEAALGCPLLELWGMTELGGLGTTHSFYGPRRLGSIGKALPHLEARIVTVDKEPVPVATGEIGELHIRGAMTMRGYLGRPEATAEVLDAEGWLHTGDMARLDEDGYIYVVDRLKDMIITGGYNIYPAEIERVLSDHPDVAMVAVGSVADELKGEIPKAYVVPRPGRVVDIDKLELFCRERLAAYKVPRQFQVVSDFPKTSSGKILRRKLNTLESH